MLVSQLFRKSKHTLICTILRCKCSSPWLAKLCRVEHFENFLKTRPQGSHKLVKAGQESVFNMGSQVVGFYKCATHTATDNLVDMRIYE